MAYPFGELERRDARVIEETTPYGPVVIFWDGEAWAAAAYEAEVDGEERSFSARDGTIVDEGTGSRWNVAGEAVDGPFAGTRLEPIEKAYVAFWFAWADFQPNTTVWRR